MKKNIKRAVIIGGIAVLVCSAYFILKLAAEFRRLEAPEKADYTVAEAQAYLDKRLGAGTSLNISEVVHSYTSPQGAFTDPYDFFLVKIAGDMEDQDLMRRGWLQGPFEVHQQNILSAAKGDFDWYPKDTNSDRYWMLVVDMEGFEGDPVYVKILLWDSSRKVLFYSCTGL